MTERIHSLDLVHYAAQTDGTDIKRVYENLTRGSRNHLRAFVSVLQREGETYEPSYLSAEQFEEILNSPAERGGGQGLGSSQRRADSLEGRGGQRNRGGRGRGGQSSLDG